MGSLQVHKKYLIDNLTMLHTSQVNEIVEFYTEQQSKMVSSKKINDSKFDCYNEIMELLVEDYSDIFGLVPINTNLGEFVIRIAEARKEDKIILD